MRLLPSQVVVLLVLSSVFLASRAVAGVGFASGRTFQAGLATNVAIGDFNGDDKPDVIALSAGINVLLNNGDGTFLTVTISRSLLATAATIATGVAPSEPP